jgi:hypothetical protein
MTLRETVRGALLGGAIGSVALMLYASRANTHTVVSLLFVVWVLAPFVALSFAEAKAHHWTPAVRTTLHWLALGIVVVTLALFMRRIYNVPRHQPAAVFVLVPPAAILVMVLTLGVAKMMSRREEPIP